MKEVLDGDYRKEALGNLGRQVAKTQRYRDVNFKDVSKTFQSRIFIKQISWVPFVP